MTAAPLWCIACALWSRMALDADETCDKVFARLMSILCCVTCGFAAMAGR